jgi:tRNA uridine 5-carboxymethylaminomethyl modification enzyme
MPAAAAIVAHFEPGQDMGGLNGFHDVHLISNQYPNGLAISKGQCIRIHNASAPIGIGWNREIIPVEGKIAKFMDSVAPHHARRVYGVKLEDGKEVHSKTVVITTGTYLNSNILIGHEKTVSGPNGEKTTKGISQQLKDLGFEIIRLKTGTPPRIAKDSVDFSQMNIQPGDPYPYTFSHDQHFYDENPQEPCYLTHTNTVTHDIINLHLDESSMYGGVAEGTGPRYCPSIEDKVVRFSDKERHQIFIEPESIELDELYIQGFSTSLSRHVQEKIVKTLPGLENARIIKYA